MFHSPLFQISFIQKVSEGILEKKILTIGTDNISAFLRFLVDNGYAHIDDNGNTVIKPVNIETFMDLNEKFAEISGQHAQDKEAQTAIAVKSHKANSVMLEVTKAGRELRNKDLLSILYDGGELFRTGKTGTRKKPQEVKTAISLSVKAMEEWQSHIPANKEITQADIERAIHATTLYLAGNQVISTDMLFRQMNGGKDKEITPAMRKEYYDSFARLGQTWVTIDATDEQKAGYNDKKKYHGALLPCAMIIGDVTIQGKPAHDCIKIYDVSPLIAYALAKGQVSNIPIGMFNIQGVNATDENTVLIGYLTRAYASMSNPHNHIQPVITYDTLYEFLGVQGNNANTVKTRKKRIRATVRAILTAWVNGGFIKGFQELTDDNKPAKERVQAAKIRLTFYTAKELKNKLDSGQNLND